MIGVSEPQTQARICINDVSIDGIFCHSPSPHPAALLYPAWPIPRLIALTIIDDRAIHSAIQHTQHQQTHKHTAPEIIPSNLLPATAKKTASVVIYFERIALIQAQYWCGRHGRVALSVSGLHNRLLFPSKKR